MKKLKLFPKIFIYTLALLLLITTLASGTIYLLAPMMGENSVLSEGTYVDGMSSAIKTAAIPRNTEIAHTILRSLPYTVVICIVVSLLCAYFFSKAITNPIKGILDTTSQMAVLDRKAVCKTDANDEIGILANQINQLYQNLLSTIEHLQEEKDKVSETLLKKSMFIAVSLALFTCTCLMLSACAANATSAPEIPRTSGEDQPAPMNISTQVSSDVIADENCLPGGPSDTQPEYWKIEEFEVWMEQQRDQIQKLADNKDKSFYYKDDNGSYVCREWTQEDVDSLYESWQDQLALMKEGYHFTKSMELSDGSIISGAFDPETWNAAPASAHGSTIITLPDGSTVDLGHFDTADAATKAVQEYLEQQVSSGNMTQAEADNLLDNGSIE